MRTLEKQINFLKILIIVAILFCKQTKQEQISKNVIANTNIFTVNTVNSGNIIHISCNGNYK